jgi:predicted phosphodiesterase
LRIAFVADIHGNLFPLEAVARDIKKSDVQATVCLGDVATIGIQPKEVFELLQELNCSFVMGNHDSALLEPGKAKQLLIPEHLVPSLDWTLSCISKEQMDLIGSFTDTMPLRDDTGIELLCYHGTPECNYIGFTSITPDAEIIPSLKKNNARMLIGGHTHQQMIRDIDGRILVNPGSVGSVFNGPLQKGQVSMLQPWAEYGIVELNSNGISIEMKKLSFDTKKAKADIKKTDSPLKNWWKKQYK